MSLSYRNHPIALTLTASFLISLLLLLFFGFGKAHADVSNVWPTEPAEATYYCRPASGICPGAFGNSPMYLTVGAGEFNNNVSYTKVYAFGTNYTVNIIEGTICNSTISDGYYASQPPDIYNSAYSTRFDFTDRFGNLLSSQTLGYDCANRNRTYNIGLPAGSFNPVTGRYEGYIIGSMVSPTPWTNENSFRYTFAGAEAGPGNLYGNATFSFSNRNIPSNYVHNMSVVFAPNCTMPQTGNGTIQIYDVDQGIYQGTGSYPNLTWEAYARPRELTGGGGWSLFASGTLSGGDSGTDNLPFTYNRDLEYRLRVMGLSRPNAFLISVVGVSVEDFPGTYRCQQPPSGNFSMSCQAGTGQLTVTANASDPDGDQLTITSSVTGGGANPPNYNGGGGNGIFIGNVTRPPDGSTYTVTGTVTDSAGNSATMGQASASCSRPATTFSCTASPSPAGPFEVGDRFTIQVFINASGNSQFALPMSSATHPVSISQPANVGGVGPASEWSYTISPWPGTATVNDVNVYSDVPNTYNFNVSVGGQPCPTAAVYVGLKSYMKIFGGEVMAGGGFGSTCAPANGGIYAWARTDGAAPRYAGASAQLTVSALLQVNEFYSASNRAGGNTFPPKGITFANDNALAWGGNYGGARCITDYYNATRDPTLASGNWNGNTGASLSSGRHQYTLAAATMANAGQVTIPNNVQAAVYASGTVFIRNNIVFAGGAGTWQTHPNFVLIVNGDIHIAQDVTRLDGLYISQGGTIYTCVSNVNTLFVAGDVYNNCQNQLRVNGGLIGTDIRWLRLRGTLRDAQFQEKPNFADGAGTPAGEVINYSPQVWLAPSPLRVPGVADGEPVPGSGPYDSIKELPPIF